GKFLETVGGAVALLSSLIEQFELVSRFGESVRDLTVVVDILGRSPPPALIAAMAGILRGSNGPASVRLRLLPAAATGDAEGRSVRCEDADESRAAATLRRIAITCLTSPVGSEVRAPVARLGIKAAHVALSFGANHLGQAAVDHETARVLRIPALADLAEVFRYDAPTPL
ncbi:MAG: hypothetical protein ACYC6Y_08280, partial [Thermoguttaceae bacterium]